VERQEPLTGQVEAVVGPQLAYGNVNTTEAGLLVRQENFYDWNDALAALREGSALVVEQRLSSPQ